MVRRNRIVTGRLCIPCCCTKQAHKKTSVQLGEKQPPETRAYFGPFLQLGLRTSTGQSVLHNKACHTPSCVLTRSAATRGTTPAAVHNAVARGIEIEKVLPVLTLPLVLLKASSSSLFSDSHFLGVSIRPRPLDFQGLRRREKLSDRFHLCHRFIGGPGLKVDSKIGGHETLLYG